MTRTEPLRPALTRRRLMGLTGGAVGVASLGILTGCGPFGGTAYTFQGGELDPPNPAPAIQLTDQHGQPFDLASRQGRVVMLFFGFTHCPDVCPTTLSEWMGVRGDLGERAADVDWVMVTVDPDRDTPERMAEYLDFFDPSFIGLSGTNEQIEQVKRGYGVYSEKQDSGSALDYLVNHTATTFVIDRNGNYRLTFAYGTAADIMSEDIGHLLDA